MRSSSEFFYSKLYNERYENLKCHTILLICIISVFSILRKLNVCPSVCLRVYGTIRLPLEEFSRNFIFEDFSKICQEI